MKLFLSIVFGVLSVGLAIALYVTRRDDATQHDTDVATVTQFSNTVDAVQSQLAASKDTLLTLSNSLDASQTATVTLSNQLTAATATIAANADQIASLTRRADTAESGNQALNRQVLDLTNQVTSLSQQLTTTQTSLTQRSQDLAQLGQDYQLLENRFRIDVAERTVLERRFRNADELQNQIRDLKGHLTRTVTAEDIYAGLDVEVKSNGTFHVIAPN